MVSDRGGKTACGFDYKALKKEIEDDLKQSKSSSDSYKQKTRKSEGNKSPIGLASRDVRGYAVN
jgi:hypothetical protein